MITVYKVDAQGVFVAATEIDPMGPLPVPLTMTAPPATTGTEVAQWNGNEWDVLEERPAFTAPPEPVTLDVLSVDTWQIEADSTDVATVTYTSNDTVHFVADGLLYSVEPVDSIATLEISADAPGPIPVQVQDKQIMLTAVEVPA